MAYNPLDFQMVKGQTYNTVAGLNNNVVLTGGFFRVIVTNVGDSITGLWQGSGQPLAIQITMFVSSTSADGLLLRHNDTNSLPGNRLILFGSQDLKLVPGSVAIFVYSPSLAAWYIYFYGTQIPSDWNAINGPNRILNKPTTLVGYGITDAYPLSGNPSGFLTSVPSQTWASITGKPTFATVATSGSYLDLSNRPTIKRQETYSGTTNASGNFTVTFGTAYAVAPNIQASISNQSNAQQQIRVSSVSTTGFTVNVSQRNTAFLSLLGLDILTSGTTNVSGASVDVFVTEK